jgi:twitching motility two-component system response regulator PilH
MIIKKILICDDSPVDLQNLKNALQGKNYILVEATDGQDAIHKAKAEKPDVIFLDVVMPGMDGFATCRALRDDAETKHIPVICVTSKNQKADVLWAGMQGARQLIGKPYEAKQIIEALNSL